jgi:hypothetical protein
MKGITRQKLPKFVIGSAFLIAIIGLLVLASGISTIDLRPGTTYLSKQTPRTNAPASAMIEPEFEEILIPAWAIILLLIVPLVLGTLILIFVPGARKYMLRSILLMMVWVLSVYFISNQQTDEQVVYEENETPFPTVVQPFPLEMPETDVAPLPEVDTNTSNWVSFLIAFISFLVILVVLYILYRSRFLQSEQESDEMDRVASEAASALEDINAGLDLRNVILHCYAEMCTILSKEKGIVRKQWMTPREFESRLVKIGFPEDPVRTLTELFEFVRYGAQEPARLQETQAVQSLTAIIRASRKEQ